MDDLLLSDIKESLYKQEKYSYISIFNVFLIIAIWLGFAPNELELFNMGFKTPILYVPIVLSVAHLVLSKHIRIQRCYSLKQAVKLLILKQRKVKDINDDEAFNDWLQNLMYKISQVNKPSLIVEVGDICALLSFHVVFLFLGIQFFPDLMKEYLTGWLFIIIWLHVITGLYFLLFQIHGFKLIDKNEDGGINLNL